MDVIKHKIKLGSGDISLRFPITMNHLGLGKDDLIETKFVDVEVQKSINPIIDNEIIRYKPKTDVKIEYSINLLDDGTLLPITYYNNAGFDNNDILYRKNNFKNTFLRINFYDDKITSSQQLITSNSIFSVLTKENLQATNNIGIPLPANQIPLKYVVGSLNDSNVSEGYYIYHGRIAAPRILYARFQFFNAKSGMVTTLVTTNLPKNITEITNFLYVKYELKIIGNELVYEISSDNGNVTTTNDGVAVKLYEIQIL